MQTFLKLSLYNFLEVKPKYEASEVKNSIMSFFPMGEDHNDNDNVWFFGHVTDFLEDNIKNEVDMMVKHKDLMNTIEKAKSAKFMGEFQKICEFDGLHLMIIKI